VVRSIRKKLGERAGCIATVSGVGYRYRRQPSQRVPD
jgi:DNA-binding response OmpR family regulator